MFEFGDGGGFDVVDVGGGGDVESVADIVAFVGKAGAGVFVIGVEDIALGGGEFEEWDAGGAADGEVNAEGGLAEARVADEDGDRAGREEVSYDKFFIIFQGGNVVV